jgi:uncharacterized membrane protein
LQTDASDYGIGAVLSQLDALGNEKLFLMHQKLFSLASRNTQQPKKKRLP